MLSWLWSDPCRLVPRPPILEEKEERVTKQTVSLMKLRGHKVVMGVLPRRR